MSDDLPAPEKFTASRKMERGQFTGWCTRCGGECFNFVRHKCPEGISARAFEVIRCASLLVRARTCVRQATNGTPHHARMQAAESASFDHLQSAVAALNEGNTNGAEE